MLVREVGRGFAVAETDWRETYVARRMSAADALRVLRSGDRVFVSPGCGRNALLVEELRRTVERLWDVEILAGRSLWPSPEPGRPSGHFRQHAFHVGDDLRDAVADGQADYTPVRSSEVPALFASAAMPLDVAIVQVAPPDDTGACNLGISVGLTRAAVDHARFVLAEINPAMPRTNGRTLLPVERVHAFVEGDHPLDEVSPPAIDDVSRRIAEHCERLIPDRATLRLGNNGVAAAIAERLLARGGGEFGWHGEMFTEAAMDLMLAGIVTNAHKTVDRGVSVACRCVGTRRLYDFVRGNLALELRGEDEVSDPARIAAQERMVAVARVEQVDLTGQVADEFTGARFGGGFGARYDFLRGAAASRGGRPIVALPSTSPDGASSNIRMYLDPGAGVVAGRSDVHYVVTEWGAALVHGRSIRDRALALIAIAHPRFRPELFEAAQRNRHLPADLSLPALDLSAYPRHLEQVATLRDGLTVFIRPAHPGDERMVRTFLYGLSERSAYHRFHNDVRRMDESAVRQFVNIDYRDTMSLIAVLGASPESRRMIAIGQYLRCAGGDAAEYAFVTADEYQGRGLASFMLRILIEHARAQGYRRFVGDVLVGNPSMLRVLEKAGVPVHRSFEDGVHLIELDLTKREG
ncbi:MAG: GNAT family N-acetyltransferase [Deltaproteobacteria bacterium]|nr:GNAT family N-acetyltransferase [Deltaproteobacteria bacterium]